MGSHLRYCCWRGPQHPRKCSYERSQIGPSNELLPMSRSPRDLRRERDCGIGPSRLFEESTRMVKLGRCVSSPRMWPVRWLLDKSNSNRDLRMESDSGMDPSRLSDDRMKTMRRWSLASSAGMWPVRDFLTTLDTEGLWGWLGMGRGELEWATGWAGDIWREVAVGCTGRRWSCKHQWTHSSSLEMEVCKVS